MIIILSWVAAHSVSFLHVSKEQQEGVCFLPSNTKPGVSILLIPGFLLPLRGGKGNGGGGILMAYFMLGWATA